MNVRAICFALCSTIAISIAASLPVQAQRARVFVASYGNDNNPCTFGSPCRTFQGAHDAVAAGGEITALDSAGFGVVNIDKSITITSPPGIEASIAAPAGAAAINILAGKNDVITIRGLTLNGAASANRGIDFSSGAKLAIIDCFITNYIQYGIYLHTSSTYTSVLISNTTVSEAAGGIVLSTVDLGIDATFRGLVLDNNTDSIELLGNGVPIHLMIADTQIGTNSEIGIYSKGNPNYASDVNSIQLQNVTFTSMNYNIYLDGDTTVSLSHVTQLRSLSEGIGPYCAHSRNAVFSDGTNNLPVTDGCTIQVIAPN